MHDFNSDNLEAHIVMADLKIEIESQANMLHV